LQPSGDPILLVGRERRQLGEDVFERLGHALRILSGRLPNNPLQLAIPPQGHRVRSWCRLGGAPAAERQGASLT
jgi:hypothetical protein